MSYQAVPSVRLSVSTESACRSPVCSCPPSPCGSPRPTCRCNPPCPGPCRRALSAPAPPSPSPSCTAIGKQLDLSQNSQECKHPRRHCSLLLVILTFDILTPKLIGFRDSWCTVSVSGLVILAAAFLRCRADKQTNRQTPVKTVPCRRG